MLLLLSHCATKHQPREYAPYFALRPEGQLGSDQLVELKALQAQTSLSPLQKKRLLDLYLMDSRHTRAGTPRAAVLGDAIEKLRRDVQELDRELVVLQADLRTKLAEPLTEKPVSVFQSSLLKREFQESLSLWNHNQAIQALKKIDDVVKGQWANAAKSEKMKFLNLRFRVLLEEANLTAAGLAYSDMRALDHCDADTAHAGFLFSLVTFTAGDARKALSLFKAQCDPDTSQSNLLRRKYWLARFGESEGETSAQMYQEIAESTIPGYHAFLAQVRLGKKLQIPQVLPRERIYLKSELRVSSDVDECLLSAEARLDSNLRRDANLYLLKASRLLRKQPKVELIPVFLYTAHLFHAAGSHLEALKLYAVVTTLLQDSPSAEEGKLPVFADMFPRPFAERVEWLGRMWGIDPDFIYSIMRQESAFNPAAVSVVDARGLMQLRPSLARSLSRQWSFLPYYTDRALFSADENLKLGVFHMHQLQDLIPHVALIAASYNAGINRVINWWRRYENLPLDVFVELVPVTETRNYIKLVLRNLVYYKALRANAPLDPAFIPFQMGRFPSEYAHLLKEDNESLERKLIKGLLTRHTSSTRRATNRVGSGSTHID